MRNKIISKAIIAGLFFTLGSISVQGQTIVEAIEPVEQNLHSKECSEIRSRILGSWFLEKSPLAKIVFTSDNKLKRYYYGVLKSTDTFSISSFCDGESLSQGYFLVTTSGNGSEDCAYLDNVNYNNSGFLTLVAKDQGKIIIYKKFK